MKYLAILSILTTLSLTECNDSSSDVKENCGVQVKVIELALDSCNLLLEKKDGEKRIPVEVVPDFELEAGQKLFVGYTEVNTPNICMAGKAVRVDCIRGVQSTINCQQNGQMFAASPEEYGQTFQSQLMLQNLIFENGMLKVQMGYSGCGPERNFRLVLDPAISKSLPPQRNAKIVFEEEMCEAFFTQTICFPVKDIAQETILKIADGSGNLRSIKIKP